MDEATWYLDSDDSSPLGSPSTPPALNGEWPSSLGRIWLSSFRGHLGEAMRGEQAKQESCPGCSHSRD